jgi:hypothetical protein
LPERRPRTLTTSARFIEKLPRHSHAAQPEECPES